MNFSCIPQQNRATVKQNRYDWQALEQPVLLQSIDFSF